MKAWLKSFTKGIIQGLSGSNNAYAAGGDQMHEELLLNRADIELVEQILPRLRGWLFPEAACMTCHLVRKQTDWGVRGGGVEIGVYEGRYLSLIHKLLAERSDIMVGIDTFQFISQTEVVRALTTALGAMPSNLYLIERDSATILPEEIYGWAKGKPTIISIDGDHSAAAVKRDLVLADAVLGDGGLVIADDFMNHFAVGVTEGIYSYLSEKTVGLAPCVFIGQKLFFCRPADAERYRAAAFQFGQYGTLKSCEVFRDYLGRSRAYVEPSIAGHKVVMFVSPHCDATYGAL